MDWLVKGAQPNDSLFFHCWSGHLVRAQTINDLYLVAGHGGWTLYKDGDEADSYNEGLRFLPILPILPLSY